MSPAEFEIESIESDEDMDVEELRLEDLKNEEVATPGVEEQHNYNEDEVDDVNNDDDDDDDEGGLEAELEQALESQADEEENGGVQVMPNGIAPVAVEQPVQVHTFVEESSSESEEE